jgi:hypothetical protein
MSEDPSKHRVCVDVGAPVAPGNTVTTDMAPSVATSERLLLTPDEMDARTDRQLRDLIKGLIDSVETGPRDGADKIAVIARGQYYMQELARREQDGQTKSMVAHAATVKNCTWGITIMTIVIMFATVLGMVHSH